MADITKEACTDKLKGSRTRLRIQKKAESATLILFGEDDVNATRMENFQAIGGGGWKWRRFVGKMGRRVFMLSLFLENLGKGYPKFTLFNTYNLIGKKGACTKINFNLAGNRVAQPWKLQQQR